MLPPIRPTFSSTDDEHAVTVKDKTGGLASVDVVEEVSDEQKRLKCLIRIQERALIFPVASTPDECRFSLTDSKKISIKKLEKFFRIRETGACGKRVFYIDPKKELKGVAYDVYDYLPQSMTEEEAVEKISLIELEFPKFERRSAVMNRHGLAVFGYDAEEECYRIFWDKPGEESIEEVACRLIEIYEDGRLSHIKSEDGFLNLRYNGVRKRYFLNAEPAEEIDFEKFSQEGGALVADRTGGKAKAVYLEKKSLKQGKPVYRIQINDKFLIFPVASKPKQDPFLLMGSRQITFLEVNGFIEVREIDRNGQHIYYVDPEKDVQGIAYDAYNYLPKEMSEEEAREKIGLVHWRSPDFEAELAAYNRHGTAVFGFDEKAEDYKLFYAQPDEEEVQEVPCDIIERYRDGGTSIAKSENGFVNFRYNASNGSFYLNAEPAELIKLRI